MRKTDGLPHETTVECNAPISPPPPAALSADNAVAATARAVLFPHKTAPSTARGVPLADKAVLSAHEAVLWTHKVIL